MTANYPSQHAGALLSPGMGWKGTDDFKGEYTVDEVEHSGAPDSITIRARSADLRGSLKTTLSAVFITPH